MATAAGSNRHYDRRNHYDRRQPDDPPETYMMHRGTPASDVPTLVALAASVNSEGVACPGWSGA